MSAPLPEALAKSVPDIAHLKISMNFSELRACVQGADNFWPIPCCQVLGTNTMLTAGSVGGQAISEPPAKKMKKACPLQILDAKRGVAGVTFPQPALPSHGADEAAGSAPTTPCSHAAASEDEGVDAKGGTSTPVDQVSFEPPVP